MISRQFHFLAFLCLAGSAAAQTGVPYAFGDPDGNEQGYIERINRARRDPVAEGVRLAATTHPGILYAYGYYKVNLTMMKAELAVLPAQPPLVPNAGLMASARGHSEWMFANAQQAHDQPGGKTFIQRITSVAYPYSLVGENVFAYGMDEEDVHAGFEVDWGPGGTGGMQAGRTHRANNHSSVFREIGIGLVKGSRTVNGNTVGPEILTQDFGVQGNSPVFGTGVAYYDLDGDNFYAAGEGIAGLTVGVDGAEGFCLTARGGGWVLPVPATAATRAVTFSWQGTDRTVDLNVPANANAKADLKLAYTAPGITSSSQATAGIPHLLALAEGSTCGVTGYRLTRWDRSTIATETCDTTAKVTPAISGGYSLLNSAIRDGVSGASFHLANPNATSQSVELKTLFHGGSTAALTFMSRVRTSTSSEKFKVQVKEEGTGTWMDVYSQSGGGPAEPAFTARTVPLAGMAEKIFRVRFLLHFATGSYYPSGGDGNGWFIDTIHFTDVSGLQNPVEQEFTGTSGSFTPTLVGEQFVLVQPIISARAFPGATQILTVLETPPVATEVEFAGLAQQFNGLPRPVAVTSDPVGPAISVTYDGSPVAPVAIGNYTVVATVTSKGYTGSATGTLVVNPAEPDAQFVLTADSPGHGIIEGNPAEGLYTNGSLATLTAVADPGYLFAGWTGDAGGTANPLELVMDSYKTIGASFVPDTGDSDADGFTNHEEARLGPIPSGLRVNDRFTLDLNGIDWGAGKAMTVSGLPAGLSYNAKTRIISGVISGKPGTYTPLIRIWSGRTLTRSLVLPLAIAPFPSGLAGNYRMLVETRDTPARPAGMLRFTLSQAGLWTGSLSMPGQALRSGRGSFVLKPGENAILLTAVFPATRWAPAATVNCEIHDASELVSGSLSAGAVMADVRGFRLATGTRLPAAAHRLTMVLEPAVIGDGTLVPGGIGWAIGTVATNGALLLQGTLGDAQKFTASAAISAAGQAIIWAQPYRNSASYFGGVVSIGDFGKSPLDPAAPTTADGLKWSRAPDAAEAGYPAGFAEQSLTARTSRWTVPTTAIAFGSVLGLNAEQTMGVEFLADATPNLPESFRLGSTYGLTTIAPANPIIWTGSANRGIGTFAGSLRFPTVIGSASGVFVQDTSFASRIGSGLVKIPLLPGTGVKPFRTAGMVLNQN